MSHSALQVHVVDAKGGILSLVRRARSHLVLVCPQLCPERTTPLAAALAQALERRVHATLVVADEPAELERGQLAYGQLGERGLQVLAASNLHAELYVSEQEAVVASSNLLGSSLADSTELALLVSGQPLHGELCAFVLTQVLPHTRVLEGPRRAQLRSSGAAR